MLTKEQVQKVLDDPATTPEARAVCESWLSLVDQFRIGPCEDCGIPVLGTDTSFNNKGLEYQYCCGPCLDRWR